MKLWLLAALLLTSLTSVAAATADDLAADSAAPGATKARAYPGGRDDEDLKVQEVVPAPSTTVDRRTIELRVLNNYFKKPAPNAESSEKAE